MFFKRLWFVVSWRDRLSESTIRNISWQLMEHRKEIVMEFHPFFIPHITRYNCHETIEPSLGTNIKSIKLDSILGVECPVNLRTKEWISLLGILKLSQIPMFKQSFMLCAECVRKLAKEAGHLETCKKAQQWRDFWRLFGGAGGSRSRSKTNCRSL